MATTTIRLDKSLKARLAEAASRAGTNAHAFVLEAVTQRVEQSELAHEFHRLAEKRWAKVARGGKTLSLEDAEAHLAQRAAPALLGGQRELVIGRGAQGYLARYRDLVEVDVAVVLAIRSQRALGYRQ